MISIRSRLRRLAALLLTVSTALISAVWVAICAAAPEFIWQGLSIGPGHFTRTDLLSALLLGAILAFFVEPLIRQAGDLVGPASQRKDSGSRNPLFTAGLGLAFALVSVCVHEAMTTFVSGRGVENAEGSSGLAAAIALTTAWSIVPFAITLAWLSVRSRWLRVPIGLIGGASPGIAGWLFAWSGHTVITTSIPCLLILGLGYRCITKEPTHLALVRCAPVIALVAGGWLISAVLFDTLIDVNLFGQPKLYTQAELWADVRFYLGWAMGLILAPPPSNAISYETVERSRNS
jgi:hypothetical protein